jgi:hypothetical protein
VLRISKVNIVSVIKYIYVLIISDLPSCTEGPQEQGGSPGLDPGTGLPHPIKPSGSGTPTV